LAESTCFEIERSFGRHSVIRIAIAVAGIAVLTRKPSFWYLSVLFGAVGVLLLVQGLWPR
jgi:Domain of unknown function (DUF4337)